MIHSCFRLASPPGVTAQCRDSVRSIARLTSTRRRSLGNLRAIVPSGWLGKKRWRYFEDRPQNYVLGADTIVVVDDAILGKPRDEDDAARMLRLLSGRTHAVITGVCIVSPVPSVSGKWPVMPNS